MPDLMLHNIRTRGAGLRLRVRLYVYARHAWQRHTYQSFKDVHVLHTVGIMSELERRCSTTCASVWVVIKNFKNTVRDHLHSDSFEFAWYAKYQKLTENVPSRVFVVQYIVHLQRAAFVAWGGASPLEHFAYLVPSVFVTGGVCSSAHYIAGLQRASVVTESGLSAHFRAHARRLCRRSQIFAGSYIIIYLLYRSFCSTDRRRPLRSVTRGQL